jgi:hypothetical protein
MYIFIVLFHENKEIGDQITSDNESLKYTLRDIIVLQRF